VALLPAVLAGSLAGCSGSSKASNERCDEVAEYQASRDAPGLNVPEGLAAPNKASVYTVPPASGAELQGAPCLARPPPYFRPEPPGAPASPPAPSTAPPAN
jgi:uncharacterized lipoprotein